jgi:hypothetical protein
MTKNAFLCTATPHYKLLIWCVVGGLKFFPLLAHPSTEIILLPQRVSGGCVEKYGHIRLAASFNTHMIKPWG